MVTIPDLFAGNPSLPLTTLVVKEEVGKLLTVNPVVDREVIELVSIE